MVMEKDVSCHNFRGLMAYLRRYYGDEGVRKVTNGLIDNDRYLIADKYNLLKILPIQEEHLTDPAYWVSYEFSLALLANVKKVVGGPKPLFEAGDGAAMESFSKSALFLSRVFGLKFLSRRVAGLTARFNRTKEVELVELTNKSASFALHYYPQFQVAKDICNWNLGIYTGIARMTGASGVKCEEIKCIVGGDGYCLFRLTWKEASLKKRVIRWLIRTNLRDLLSDYEAILKDREQLIDKLTQSEKRYRALFEHSPIEMITVDQEGKVTEYNRVRSKSGGRLPDIGDIMYKDYAGKHKINMFGELMASIRSGISKEFPEQQYDGTFFHTRISPFPDGAIITSIDITGLKRAQEALHIEKERFRVLVEESPLGVSLIGEDGHYKYINPKFIEIFDYTLEDIPTGREWFSKAYPNEEYRNQVISTWISDLKEPKASESRPRTFNVRCKDGSEKAIHFRPVALETGEQLVIYEDITERKRLETQLQRAQKMEAIATLAGGIAHDFNNILMAIQGRISLMLMGKDSSHPDFEHLTGIDDQIESAADLTKQLLGFARGGKYEVRPTDLNELIKSHNRMFGRTKKEITIRGKYEKDLWIVEADQGQIDQVLMNLYVNAWQAMPGGGNLHVQTENVLIDEDYDKMYQIEPGRYVKISVADTGVGMDDSVQKRIFDPFFTTKEMGTGTGLGLASVYGIIKNHGGFINVYSEEGNGSTFNIYLPAIEAEGIAQRAESKIKKGIVKGDETVLFVDDEDMIIEVVEEILEQLGYKVLTAKSGKEAIETYEKNKEQIDIVILDMVMPDMGGVEAYDKLEEINPDIKVLLASGYSLNEAATGILERGCNGFIQKPAKMRELSQKLREILDS